MHTTRGGCPWIQYHAQFGLGFGVKGGGLGERGGKREAERRGVCANSTTQLYISLLAKSLDGVARVLYYCCC